MVGKHEQLKFSCMLNYAMWLDPLTQRCTRALGDIIFVDSPSRSARLIIMTMSRINTIHVLSLMSQVKMYYDGGYISSTLYNLHE